jgi:polyhydroxybutyrate depolymerase
MKKYLLLLLFPLFVSNAFSARYVLHTWDFGGLSREYYLYVPNSYDSSKPMPFVLALHGLGDTISNFIGIGMDLVADTANFILAVPQAIAAPGFGTAWNSGAGEYGISPNPTVDDVGFLNAIIDSTAAYYNLDQKRLYCTGFSMGGFMTNRLGCELTRFAAIASVSGTIGTYFTCSPTRVIPSCHFHGTADPFVGFTTDMFGLGAWQLVDYWRNYDHCDTTPAFIDTIPDPADTLTYVHYKYPNGKFGTNVEFYEVINGVHEWIWNDVMNYSVAIWRFFRQYTWTDQVSAINNLPTMSSMKVYPNPANDAINFEYSITGLQSSPTLVITDLMGRVVFKNELSTAQTNYQGDVKSLPAGSYTYNVGNSENGIVSRGIFVVAH